MKKRGVVKSSKAQASFEYMILFSLFIAILAIILYYTSSSVTDYIKNNELGDAAKTITNQINQIGAMEVGAEKIVMYKIPKVVKQGYINYKEINFKSMENGKLSDTHFQTIVPAYGFLEVGVNQHFLILKKEENGYVSINPLGEPNLTKDLVAHYNFDLGNSTHTLDVSGNANHGEYNGDIDCTVDGHIGNGCEFDGIDDYIEMNPINLSEISIALWINLNQNDKNQQIIASREASSYGNFWLMGNSTKLMFDTYTTAQKRWTTSGDYLTENEWMFVVLTFDQYNKKLFINKNNVETQQNSFIPLNNTATKMRFGTDSRSLGYYLNGTLDEIMIWNRTLTDSEIEKIYLIGYKE